MIDLTSIPDVSIVDTSRGREPRCRAGEAVRVSQRYTGPRPLCYCLLCQGKRDLGAWLARVLGAP